MSMTRLGIPSIQPLLTLCCPPAILSGVRPIDIDAVDSVSRRRLRSHVPIKHGEVVPLGRDGDASPTVVAVVVRRRFQAAASHMQPRFVFRDLERQPVSRHPLGVQFFAQASTRGAYTATETAAVDRLHGAAIAPADPVWGILPGRRTARVSLDHSPPSEAVARAEEWSTLLRHRVTSGAVPRAVTSGFGALLRCRNYNSSSHGSLP